MKKNIILAIVYKVHDLTCKVDQLGELRPFKHQCLPSSEAPFRLTPKKQNHVDSTKADNFSRGLVLIPMTTNDDLSSEN